MSEALTAHSPAQPRTIFESPIQIVVAAILAALLVGALMARDVQLGVALLAATLFTPLALLNLPLACAFWVPLAYLESWPQARYVPAGVAILLGLAWLGTLNRGGSQAGTVLRRHAGAALLLMLFIVWVTLSVAWASDTGAAADGLYLWFWAGAIWVVVATTLSTRRQLVTMCAAFVIAALISIAIALPQLTTAPLAAEEELRLGGSLQNPNYLAAALLSAAALTAGLTVVTKSPIRRRALLISVAVITLAMFVTGSRGGLIAALVALLVAFALLREYRLRLGTVIAATVAVIAVFVVTSSGQTLDRVREFDTSGTGRVDLWEVSLRMWSDQPWLGVGLENFPVESREYLFSPGEVRATFIVDEPKQTHNAYLGILAETGVVGLMLFVAVIFAMLRITWAGVRRLEAVGDLRYATLGRAILIAQIGPLVALMFAHNPFNHPFWILLGLGPVLVTLAENPEDRPDG